MEKSVDKRWRRWYSNYCCRGHSSSGRAPPCQGGGSEFEPRCPLQTDRSLRRVACFLCFVLYAKELAASTGKLADGRANHKSEARQGSSSPQASLPSLSAKTESSLTALRLLSPRNLLDCVGAPLGGTPFVGCREASSSLGVLTSSISFAYGQSRKLTHSAARPFPARGAALPLAQEPCSLHLQVA